MGKKETHAAIREAWEGSPTSLWKLDSDEAGIPDYTAGKYFKVSQEEA